MRTIVATDLMARGVDSSHANLVINLDPPNDLVTYLHRIGRAGRFGSKGIAITFISSPQQCQSFKRIIAEAGTGMSVLQFPTDSRAGFNFWDYASYDFPYYLKTEACEQEENELKRIKQRWKTPGDEGNVLNAIEISDRHFENDENTAQNHTVSVDSQKYLIKTNDVINNMDKEPIEAKQKSTDDLLSVKSQIKSLLNEHEKKLNVFTVEETQGHSIIEENKENIIDNQVKYQALDDANIAHKATGEVCGKLAGPQELTIELVELTPSTEMPGAAPNSINTKTYCLVAPTESTSTTLHPQGVSNTVDDASSIISDSMENDYDSDASYTSCYSDGDLRIIWQRALSQQKLQKRRQRNARRHIYLYHKRRNMRNVKECTYECDIEDEGQPEVISLKVNHEFYIVKYIKKSYLIQEWLDEPNEKELHQLQAAHSQRPRKFQIDVRKLIRIYKGII